MGSNGFGRGALGALLVTLVCAGTAQAAPPVQSLIVTGSSANGTYATGGAALGAADYDLTGPAVLAPGSACGTLAPVPAGTILLVNRGGCAFPLIAENAQTAGAAGVVIMDNLVAAAPFVPTGSSSAVTIPVAAVTKAAGDALKSAIGAGDTPTAQLVRHQPLFTVTALDGAFPDQVVGTTGPARRFAIQNTGTADGVIGATYAGTTTGPGSNGALTPSDDFLVGLNSCPGSTLAPGASCMLYVRFAPSRDGDIDGMAGASSRRAARPWSG